MKIRKLAAGISLSAMALTMSGQVQASSHREAPFITKNPKVDASDLYAFMSYEDTKSDNVVLIANYQPLQDAYGGPNYFAMDPEALYEIHVENNGDGVEDLTFQFQFQNALNGTKVGTPAVAIPLVNSAGIKAAAYGTATDARNVRETFTLNAVKGPRRGSAPVAINNNTAKFNGAVAAGQNTFIKPTDNIGTKTFGTTLGGEAYASYAAQHVYDIALPASICADGTAHTGRVFVGQRQDTFAVNLGVIFDLINAPVGVIAGGVDEASRNLAATTINGKNVTSMALEIPKECLITAATSPVIGVWTTASVRQARVINPKATYGSPAKEGGAWTQVSRLGNPLVNEVVIGLPDKDRFNSSEPKDDAANFGPYVLNPTLPVLIATLFPEAPAPTIASRSDLAAVFLTGVKTTNSDAADAAINVNYTGATLAEMLRLNTALGATTTATGRNDSGLGAAACFRNDATAPTKIKPSAAGCDVAGFPNGRRPGDDVVDLALRVMEGYLLPITDAPAGATPFTDGVLQFFGAKKVPDTTGTLTQQSQESFPFLNLPTSGT